MPTRIQPFRPPRLRVRRRETRANAHQRGYCDAAHKAWRLAVLTRDAWTCRDCGKVCTRKRDAHADHIVPVSHGGERYDVANGACRCASCHARKGLRDGTSGLRTPGAGGRS